jgi:hypothetical protein
LFQSLAEYFPCIMMSDELSGFQPQFTKNN